MSDPVKAVETIGKAITLSRIFGCQNESQGQVLALECFAKQLPPLALAEQYHLIDGKLSMKADAMLAGFEDMGGEYEIKEYSPDACEIIFRREKNELAIRITWEMAQQEKWPFGKGKELKTNWSTPIGRQDMLWARVVSRGVRKLAPGVVCGRYTPEELIDSTEHVIDVQPVPAIEKAKQLAQEQADQVEDAAIEESCDIESGEAKSLQGRISANTSEPCSLEQVEAIKSALAIASQVDPKITAKIKDKLAKHGFEKIAELNMLEADKLKQAIENNTIKKFFELELIGVVPF